MNPAKSKQTMLNLRFKESNLISHITMVLSTFLFGYDQVRYQVVVCFLNACEKGTSLDFA